jgi:arylsulfatase A-like enzyme
MAWAVLAAVVLAMTGCPRGLESVAFDLTRDAALAEWLGPDGTRVVASPPTEIFGARGPRSQSEDPPGATAPPSLEVRLFATWPARRPREVVLRLASGPDPVTTTLVLNRTAVGHVPLRPGRHTYRVALPKGPQRSGRNTLRLTFTPGSGSDLLRRHPFRGAVILPAGSPAAAALADGDRPLFERRDDGEDARLLQMAPGRIRFALRLPDRARLRVGVRAMGEDAAGRYRVIVERPGREPEDILSGNLGEPPRAREHVVDLPGRGGALVWLSLAAESGGDGLAGVQWLAPRVTGAPPPLPPPIPDGEVTRLRARLRGKGIVLVVLDAARAREFSTYGYERATTLEIDRLGREGVVFEQAYTPASYTRSAMSSVWTSLDHEQHHDGVGYLGPLPADYPTLAEILEAHGVPCRGFVANPAAGPSFGFDRGFSEFRLFRGREGRVAARAGELVDAVAARLVESSPPAFTYVHFLEPHYPYDPPERFVMLFGPDAPIPRDVRRHTHWIEAVNRRRRPFPPEEQAHLVRLYDGSLAYADREIGRLRRILEDRGLLDEVIFIVTADHGDELFERGLIGHGSRVYGEQVHIPLVLRFPRGAGLAGLRVRAHVNLLDVAPTILDCLGLTGSGDAAFEGRSLLPVLYGAAGKPLLVGRTMHDRPTYYLKEGSFKLVHSVRSGRSELYDLDEDPGETHDLAGELPVRTEFYRQTLYRWLRDLKRHRATRVEASVSPEDEAALRALGYVE